MCGIVGIFNYGGSSTLICEDILKAMSAEIAHRGPDDDGIYISPDGTVGFGFRRLAIIDLSPAGHQPMSNALNSKNPEGDIWIVFNGEIYNHLELRQELERKGYRYKGRSDTETLLYAYQEWGIECIKKFYGMFSIALWDSRSEELYLIRDRIGIKPLYYTFQHGALFFASEIKAILKHPSISKELNLQGLYDYLSLLTTPPGETLFKNIFKLEAGHYARITRQGDMQKVKYWDLTHQTEPFPQEEFYVESFCVRNIRRLLRDSIKLRMISDVPFGVMLSGGIDSSMNVALMSELMSRPVETFTVGFKDLEKYNELEYARQIATVFHTNHHEILLTEQDAIDFLPKMVWHQDEPNADPVCVPLYFVSKLACDSGTIVVQVGEGSDEEFSGYLHYLREWRYYYYYYSLLPQALKDIAYRVAKMLRGTSLPAEYARRASENDVPFYGGAVSFTEEMKRSLLTASYRHRLQSSGRIVEKFFSELQQLLPDARSEDYLRKMIYAEFKSRLAELLLMRVDKMSMAVSIEARVPFLDHRLVEFAFRIPQRLKLKHGEPKYIMKKAAEGILPDNIIYRKKQGFAAPSSEWLRSGKLSPIAEARILGSGLMKMNLFSKKYIQRLFEEHRTGTRSYGSQLWTLLVLAEWYAQHFERSAPN
ncbi:MAG: asparagine synthase (glutamine-hydrolyzing) [Candidatus Thermochlorobacter sp.]